MATGSPSRRPTMSAVCLALRSGEQANPVRSADREALAQFLRLPPADVGQVAVKDPVRERPRQIGDVLPVPRPQNAGPHPLHASHS
jgi:hypothetical protein